jgi:hypothetical protein
VATVANMAASDQDINGPQAAAWANTFYGLLVKGKSVYKAFELVRAQLKTPIRAVRHQDVMFA